LVTINGNNVNVGNATTSTHTAYSSQYQVRGLSILDGSITVGTTTFTNREFEVCLTHLLKLTKEVCPEEFI